MIKKVLTIAGSDCSGGAGIQADLKTIAAHKMYGMSVITALTAQNTLGVEGILDVDAEFVGEQIEAVFNDIIPDAVKIGMVNNESVIRKIGVLLDKYKPQNIVVDTVMVSTSGHSLIDDNAYDALVAELIGKATIITPNIPEAEVLSGMKIVNKDDMYKAALKIKGIINDAAILIKGGHMAECSDDLLLYNGKEKWFTQTHIDNDNTHGTGCTLSSAIACELASGKNIEESVKVAKEYITGAIKWNLNIGRGKGPLNHMHEYMSR